MQWAGEAFQRLMRDDIKFTHVLDIGCGTGAHTFAFRKAGYKVTPIDHVNSFPEVQIFKYGIGPDAYFQENGFDLIWCSHCLEHQMNTLTFLECIQKDLKMNGWFAVTVPPLKHEIVGGHVTLWNAGLLLYNLVLAGFNCSKAKVKSYGYNISVIVQKTPMELPDNLIWDRGDIEKLKPFLPPFFRQGVNGQIQEWNW